MPDTIVAYLKGIFYSPSKLTCTMMASVIGRGSHDTFTRLLSRAAAVGQTLLTIIICRLFGELKGGFLIIDDTVIAKKFSKVIEYVFWVYSSKEERTVQGLNIVVLCWSNGTMTIPLGFRLWKDNGKSKCDLARQLLRHAKKILKLSPDYVLFDTFYAAKEILRLLKTYRWNYVTKLKKNRIFNGMQLKTYRRNPYWCDAGVLNDGSRVVVARHGTIYFATNNLALVSREIRALYKKRWAIEEVFRFLHSKLGMDDCQARTGTAQENHITLCFLAHVCIEKERIQRGWSRYYLKRTLSLQRERFNFITLKTLFHGA